jgi:hypothetical protein
MPKLRWKVLLVIGLIAGMVQVVAGVMMYVAGVYFSAWSMLLNVALLVLCIVLGIRWYRDDVNGGQITYWQALIVGIVISVSTGIIYALYNVISISFIYPHFLDDMIREGVARIQASGLSSQQTTELVASMKRNATVPRIALGNLIRLSMIGAALSAIVAITLRRKRASDLST